MLATSQETAIAAFAAPFANLSELCGDELLGLPAPVVPLQPQFFAVVPNLSEHQSEACQLGFSRRQLRR
jgi:hypothetical protein